MSSSARKTAALLRLTNVKTRFLQLPRLDKVDYLFIDWILLCVAELLLEVTTAELGEELVESCPEAATVCLDKLV